MGNFELKCKKCCSTNTNIDFVNDIFWCKNCMNTQGCLDYGREYPFNEELQWFKKNFAEEIDLWKEDYENIDNMVNELYNCELNYNNADITSGQIVYREEEIRKFLEMIKGG